MTMFQELSKQRKRLSSMKQLKKIYLCLTNLTTSSKSSRRFDTKEGCKTLGDVSEGTDGAYVVGSVTLVLTDVFLASLQYRQY